MKTFYNELNPVIKNNTHGKQIFSFLENEKHATKYPVLETGESPYDFELKDMKCNVVKLSSINCNVILLDFWGSGCSHCRMEHKNYVDLYKDLKEDGFEIISISVDQSKKWLEKAIKEDNMS